MTTFTRRTVLASMGAALATPALLRNAHAAEVTLRLAHLLPPVAPMHTQFFEVWAKELSEASDGAIDVQIFPAMQLGGKPPQLADQVQKGIADIAWTLPVYTPDRFPVAETMSLPFMVSDAEKSSVVMHKLMDEFSTDEYRGIKPLAFHMHAGGKIHTRDKPVTSQADLKGLKLRAPNQSTGDMLAALGAEVVFFPVPDMVTGLASGVIDGCCLPYEVVPAFKLQELTKYSAEPAQTSGRGLYGNTFSFIMNEAKYESLSDDVRAVIDANSGIELSQRIGKQFDAFEAGGRGVVEKVGNEIVEIPAEEINKWREEAGPVHEAWTAKLEQAGYDGSAILARANALLDAG